MNLWLDESVSYFSSQQSFSYLFNNLDFHPPLYYILLKFWIYLFSDSIIAMRSLSVILGILCVYFSYRIFNYFSDNNKWFFIINLILNTTFLYHSTQIRQYILALLFVLITIHLFLKNSRWFFIPLSLSIYSHYLTIIAYIPLLYYYRKEHLRQYFYAMWILIPYLLTTTIQQLIFKINAREWADQYYPLTKHSLIASYLNYIGNVQSFKDIATGLLFLLLIIYIIVIIINLKRNWKQEKYKFLSFYLILPILMYLISLIKRVYSPRYFFFIMIFFLILVYSSKVHKVFFIFFTLINLIIAVNFYYEQDYVLRDVSDYLIEQQPDIVIHEFSMTLLPVMYYTRNENFIHLDIPNQPEDVYGGELVKHMDNNQKIYSDLEELDKLKKKKKDKKKIFYLQHTEHYCSNMVKSFPGLNVLSC